MEQIGRLHVGHEIDAEMHHEGGVAGRRGGDPGAEIVGQPARLDEFEEGPLHVGVGDHRLRRDARSVGEDEAARAAGLDRDARDRGLQPHHAAARLDRAHQRVGEPAGSALGIEAAVEIIAEQRDHLGAGEALRPSLI